MLQRHFGICAVGLPTHRAKEGPGVHDLAVCAAGRETRRANFAQVAL
jgi:hypothetical protein